MMTEEQKMRKITERKPKPLTKEESEPDWDVPCCVCGQLPTHPLTDMCGPCTFGEADTAGGNW